MNGPAVVCFVDVVLVLDAVFDSSGCLFCCYSFFESVNGPPPATVVHQCHRLRAGKGLIEDSALYQSVFCLLCFMLPLGPQLSESKLQRAPFNCGLI